jgi:hypothetical protein
LSQAQSGTATRREPRPPLDRPIQPASFYIDQESHNMSKHEKSNRESKKQPLLTPKEKKAVKQAKKHAGDSVPLIIKNS